jgi:hypothetical protein
MPPPFRLELPGDPAFSGPDGPVRGRAAHKRRVALLAILAMARGRPVGRERIIGLLWPELTTEAARHNLSESLYVLRKELGEGSVSAPSAGDEAPSSCDEALPAATGEGLVVIWVRQPPIVRRCRPCSSVGYCLRPGKPRARQRARARAHPVAVRRARGSVPPPRPRHLHPRASAACSASR